LMYKKVDWDIFSSFPNPFLLILDMWWSQKKMVPTYSKAWGKMHITTNLSLHRSWGIGGVGLLLLPLMREGNYSKENVFFFNYLFLGQGIAGQKYLLVTGYTYDKSWSLMPKHSWL
jgi:hypothetical protein